MVLFGYAVQALAACSCLPSSGHCLSRARRLRCWWPALFVAGDIGKELFESRERVRVVLGEVLVHAGVVEKSLDVFACGSEIEDVVPVVRFDAVDVLEEFVGFLLHHGLLCKGGASWSVCRQGEEEFVSGAVEERSREAAGEFLGTHHEGSNFVLSTGFIFRSALKASALTRSLRRRSAVSGQMPLRRSRLSLMVATVTLRALAMRSSLTWDSARRIIWCCAMGGM